MKRYFLAIIVVFCFSVGNLAQNQMHVKLKDGSTQTFSLSDIVNVTWTLKTDDSDDTASCHNGHEYVDLGLSVKWATCNIGAKSPEEYGDYFAWGETEPKDVYRWTTYFDSVDGSDSNFEKYATNKKTVLDLEDDVAHIKWGGDWRMPTKDELFELLTKCGWKWMDQNGVNGYKVVGSNGNSIFLPAAGLCDISGLGRSAGFEGRYWASSLGSSNTASAFFFIWSRNLSTYYARDIGQSVRPVCP